MYCNLGSIDMDTNTGMCTHRDTTMFEKLGHDMEVLYCPKKIESHVFCTQNLHRALNN